MNLQKDPLTSNNFTMLHQNDILYDSTLSIFVETHPLKTHTHKQLSDDN